MKYQVREFDSAFFERSIYDVDWSGVHQNLANSGLVTTKVSSLDKTKIAQLNENEFKFCEGEVSYCKDIQSDKKRQNHCNYLEQSHLEVMSGFLDGLYVNSRFKMPWFTCCERDKFYNEWLRKAVLSEFDDICLAYWVESEIAGVVTLKFNKESATIGLIAVSPEFNGQGIGKKLLDSAEFVTNDIYGLKKISVATQLSNVGAMRFYAKQGYQVVTTAYWFYKSL
ncbi:GNAT family N-acetyltransferase [Vibrio coralliilyticus]|uniref:GNAT family N-acetyltransferase n=1 Tax=Vibrio coralliilyticus TaxID=190893 RepID=UPI0020A61A5F|nr:GNAT family N-acetyltransferase [Vibrio coralliilyticus]WFB48045.1 GNAT family N-acetyltransferase [Vibrio coralliilyticus]